MADHDRDRRPLGLWLPRQRQGHGTHHRQGEDRQCRGLHRVPSEPCRAARALSDDGDARRHDRACHRRFRPLAEACRAFRRPRGTAWHQPDLDCGAVRSRRAVLSGHGDLGGRRRQDRAVRSRARKRFRPAGSSTPTAATPPTPRNIARAARCCRSAAPRATRAAASPRWSRCCAACSPASASASSRPDGTMTAPSWRCSTSPPSAR